MEVSSFRTQFDFLSIVLNLLRRWNLGLWLVTYFLLTMKKVRESGRKSERGRRGRKGGRERKNKRATKEGS